jgi:malate dehydrogenase (oxaloacetate-decarboxylating)(NADP+)
MEPRVAFLSFSTFGDPKGVIPGSIRDAVKLLDSRKVDFEYDGEMAADVALDPALRAALYPFSRLTDRANVLVMPGLHAAHILTRAVPRLTSATTIGPLLSGLSRPAQIVPVEAGVNQILDMALLAAHSAIQR